MARTASGTGGVSQRPNGKWEARFSYLDPQTGKRKRHSSYGDTQKQAVAKRDEARARVRADMPATEARETLTAYARRWSETSLQTASVRESTRDLYAWIVEHRIAVHAIGAKPLVSIRRTEVAEYMIALERAGLAVATRRQAFAVLRSVLASAVEDGLIGKNPAESRGLRPSATKARNAAEHEERRALTAEELGKVLKAGDRSRYGRLLRLLAFTGLRRGEALALRWSDVDLDERAIYVRGTLSRVGGELVIAEPKTARSRRRVDIPESLVEVLNAEKRDQAKRRKTAGDAWGMTRKKGGFEPSPIARLGLVFTTDTGTPVEPHNVLRAVQTAAKHAEVDGVTVHTLRHTAASLLIEAGEPLKKVSEHLGHSSISITSDVYGHLTPAARRSTADRLAALIGGE